MADTTGSGGSPTAESAQFSPGPPENPQARSGYAPPVRESRRRPVLPWAAGIVALACVGAGAWFLGPWHGARTVAVSQSNHQSAGQPPTADSPLGSGAPSPASSPVDTPTDTPADSPTDSLDTPGAATATPGAVSTADPAAASTLAPGVAAFLDQYFTAINDHDYGAYVALLSPPEQSVSQSQFDEGYGSTTDSDATLQGISSADNGDVVANVTFTSHQSAAESPTHTPCTSWNISLYLIPGDNGYLLDKAPAGYHASYTACG